MDIHGYPVHMHRSYTWIRMRSSVVRPMGRVHGARSPKAQSILKQTTNVINKYFPMITFTILNILDHGANAGPKQPFVQDSIDEHKLEKAPWSKHEGGLEEASRGGCECALLQPADLRSSQTHTHMQSIKHTPTHTHSSIGP